VVIVRLQPPPLPPPPPPLPPLLPSLLLPLLALPPGSEVGAREAVGVDVLVSPLDLPLAAVLP
jgi:hypothetical protein